MFMKHAVVAALLTLCAAAPAIANSTGAANSTGVQELRNGARISWQITAQTPKRRLGLEAPAFVTWSNTAFQEAATFRLSSNYAAFIDHWQLALYRAGDKARDNPIKSYHGAATALSKPLIWRGEVDTGPALRPGERVDAILRVRDAAGNIDEVEAQSILVARYMMRRETRKLATVKQKRKRYLSDGAPLSVKTIPVRGHGVSLNLTGWEDNARPLLSGMALREDGSDFVLEQILPGGRSELVVQVARPLMNGLRAIPVGSATLDLPATQPLFAYVKGTGKAQRHDEQTPLPAIDGYRNDGWVDGGDAAGFTLVESDSGEGRAVIATRDPSENVPLYLDARKRRYVAASYSAKNALWSGDAGQPTPVNDPADPRYRGISVKYPAKAYTQIFLPHLDIERSSLRVRLVIDGAAATPLMKVRHFFADATEGRVLLTNAGRALIEAGVAEGQSFGRTAVLSVRYNALRFVGTPGTDLSVSTFDLSDNGSNLRGSYADLYRTRSQADAQVRLDKGGLLHRIKSWFQRW